jgi:5'-nucleotidase
MLFALRGPMRDQLPDLVLSGINHGHNIGDYVTYSGTIGAAIEAGLHGIPAAAFSLFNAPPDHEGKLGPLDWGFARQHIEKIILQLNDYGWLNDIIYNVNIPSPTFVKSHKLSLKPAAQGRADLCFEIKDLDWHGDEGHFNIGLAMGHLIKADNIDLKTAFSGHAVVTPININMTAQHILKDMEGQF